jgi:phosphoribosylanthranilate isomerase
MRTRVKFCGITTPEQAKAAALAGCDAIGLLFVPGSPRTVTIEQAKVIVQILPPLVSVVAVVANDSEDRIDELLDRIYIDYLQFHGEESPEMCRQFGQPYIKTLRVGHDPISISHERYHDAAALLLDTYHPQKQGGIGEPFDWQTVPPIEPHWILAGGLHPGNVEQAIQILHPYAVDVSGGIESAPGVKDVQRMQQFINKVRVADAKNTTDKIAR